MAKSNRRAVYQAALEQTDDSTTLTVRAGPSLVLPEGAWTGPAGNIKGTRAWQKLRIAAGLCKICGAARTVYAERCNPCQDAERERWKASQERYYRRRRSTTKRKRRAYRKGKLPVKRPSTARIGPGFGIRESRFVRELERKGK